MIRLALAGTLVTAGIVVAVCGGALIVGLALIGAAAWIDAWILERRARRARRLGPAFELDGGERR